MSSKGKTNYEAHNTQGTQPGHGKPKGEPENDRKQKYDQYGDGTRKRHRWEQEDHGPREGFN